MLIETLGWAGLATALAGALTAGFVTGLAGFGTGLVAAGFWLHALPAAIVPPMVVCASVAAQLVALATVRHRFDARGLAPYLVGAVIGVPLGVMALERAAPDLLRGIVGGFLVGYAIVQLSGLIRPSVGAWGGRAADAVVGTGGGILGGFAGLSGPLPLIWLQLRGGPPDAQRAVYQPFNLLVLAASALAMAVAGRYDATVLWGLVLCLPATVAGAWAGAHAYRRIDAATFRLVVLTLLLLSGAILLGREVL